MEKGVYEREITREEYEERVISESNQLKEYETILIERAKAAKKRVEMFNLMHRIIDLHYGKVHGPFS